MMVNKNYLVLAVEDFGRSLSLSLATDLMCSESEADCEATESVKDGSREVYLYELKRVYRAKPTEDSREAEVIFVDSSDA